MSNTVKISLKTYNELMATLSEMHTENKRIKGVLAMYKNRIVQRHRNVCSEYESYFNSKDHAHMERLLSDIATRKVAN